MITFSERLKVQEKYYEWLQAESKKLGPGKTMQDVPTAFMAFLLINHMIDETGVKIFTSLH